MADPSLSQWFEKIRGQSHPDFYAILGLDKFEADPQTINTAVEQRVEYLQTLSHGKQVAEAQQLLNLVAKASLCLKDPQKKAAYDQQLRQKKASTSADKPVTSTASQAEKRSLTNPDRQPQTSKTRPQKKPAATNQPQKKNYALTLGLTIGFAAIALIGLILALSSNKENQTAKNDDDTRTVIADRPPSENQNDIADNQPNEDSANSKVETQSSERTQTNVPPTDSDPLSSPDKQPSGNMATEPDSTANNDIEPSPDSTKQPVAEKPAQNPDPPKTITPVKPVDARRLNFSFGHNGSESKKIGDETWNLLGTNGANFPIQNADGIPVEDLQITFAMPMLYNPADANGNGVLEGMDEVMSSVVYSPDTPVRISISGLPPNSKWDVEVYTGLKNSPDKRLKLKAGQRRSIVPANYSEQESQPAFFHRLPIDDNGVLSIQSSSKEYPFVQAVSISRSTDQPPKLKPAKLEPPQLVQFPDYFELPALENLLTSRVGNLDLPPETDLKIKMATIEVNSGHGSFAMAQHGEGELRWSIYSYFGPSSETPPRIAELAMRDGTLVFQWLTDAMTNPKNNRLQNSAIELDLGDGNKKWVALRAPVKIDGFWFGEDQEEGVKVNQVIPWMPKASAIRTDVLAFTDQSLTSYPNPGPVTRDPGLVYFTQEDQNAFFWIEVNRKLSNSLTLEAELRNLINRKDKRFSRKQFKSSIEQLKSLNTDQSKKLAEEGERYLDIVDKLVATPIPVSVYFMLEGQKIELARTFGEFPNESDSVSIEGESMMLGFVTPKFTGVQKAQEHGWSNAAQFVMAGAQDEDCTLYFEVPRTGKYHVFANVTKAADYGAVDFAINDQPLGQTYDQYDANGVSLVKLDLGEHKLNAGTNKLQFTFAPPNNAAQPTNMFRASDAQRKAFLFGLDQLRLEQK